MTYRFYNPAPVLFDQNGLLPLAGGTVTFYVLGTTTLADTWSDPDKNTPNENPIPINADGRLATDVFLDGSYTVVIEGPDGTSLSRDVTPGDGAGQAIPALVAGQWLTNDGSNLLWADALLVPDPTGSAGKVLSNDGSNLIWVAQDDPAPPADPDIVVGTASFLAGVSSNPTKFDVRWGVATAPGSGSHETSVPITFDPPFKETPIVIAQIAQRTICSAGLVGCTGVDSRTVNGATIYVNVNDDDGRSQYNIIGSVSVQWVAIGRRDVEEEEA